MKLNTATQTTDTISERGKFFMIGLLPVYAKPLTLSQVIEIGELASNMSELDSEEEMNNLFRHVFTNTVETECMQEVALIALFRSRILRKAFGWYIRRKLNTKTLKKCWSVIHDTFDYAFFFDATVSLRGMKWTRKEQTEETAPGD